jgi:hypothetical protein
MSVPTPADGRWTEYWALADEQDAVDSFWYLPEDEDPVDEWLS